MKDLNKYETRLYKEWIQHGKLVIAVDYDSTLSAWPTIDNFEDIERTVKLLQIAHETGAYIIINTCSSPDRHVEIQNYCEKIKIPINAINASPVDLPYGKHGKVYANIYLDDRAGLTQSLDYLENVMYKVRGDKMKNLTLGENA